MKAQAAAVLSVVLVLAGAALTHDTVQTVAAPVPSTRAAAGGELAALEQARRTGTPVEVRSLLSSTTQVYALPDGTLRADVKTRPVRVWRDNRWTPIDTNLARRPDGTVAPAASLVDVWFSGGGDGPFATVDDGRKTFALTWPGLLPKPVIERDSVRYGEVLPGVDLLVTATASGFSEMLVVRDRAAALNPALARVRFGMRAGGWRPTAADLPAFMWDSAQRKRKRQMGVEVAADSVTVIPDRGLLADPQARFPLYLDPSVQLTPGLHWAMVDEGYSSQSYYDTSYHAQVGHDPTDTDHPTNRWRSYFELGTAFAANKHILQAQFQTTLLYSWSCTPEPVRLWETDSIRPDTNWSNKPRLITQVGATVSDKKAGHEACPGSTQLEFDATDLIVRAAADAKPVVTVALVADEQPGANGGKLIENDARFPDRVPGISVRYNTAPRTTLEAPACPDSGATTWIRTHEPTLQVSVTDPDVNPTHDNDPGGSDPHQFDFEIRAAASQTVLHAPARSVDGGTQYQVPPGVLGEGSYEWRARSWDHTDLGPWTAWCRFTVDTVGPSSITLVSSADFVKVAPGPPRYNIRVDQTGRFTLDAGGNTDVAGFDYQIVPVNAPVKSGRVTLATPGGAATVNYTCPVGGSFPQHAIRVWAVDAAGNRGPENPPYKFRVQDNPAGQLVVDLHMGEGQGTVAADSASNGPDGGLTLGSSVSWVDGRHGSSLYFNGTGEATAETAGPVIDTTNSFTVMSWVRLDADTDDWLNVLNHTAANGRVAVSLRYQPRARRWAFVRWGSDAEDSVEVVAESDSYAQIGAWTHLAGVYDKDLGKIVLYVNGRKAGEAPFTTVWSATGRLRVGHAENFGATQRWVGAIDEISVHSSVLSEAKIRSQMFTFDTFGPEGHWRLDETTGLFSEDSSGNGNNVVRLPGSSWTQGRHLGGARFTGNGSASWAHADRPVIQVDQSYTVAAWVKLDRADDWMTAVSQDGRWDSRFRLGFSTYNPRGWHFSVNNKDTRDDGADPPALTTAVANTPALVGVWTHLTGVYDHAAGEIRLYVNGRLAGRAPFVSAQSSIGPLVIGRWQNEGWWVGGWAGTVDDVRAVQHAATPLEIVDWMMWAKYGPSASWDFEEGSGQISDDLSDDDHVVAFDPGITWVNGVRGKALHLEGNPDGEWDGAHAYTSGPIVKPGSSFTVTAWGKLDGLGESAAIASQDGDSDSGFSLLYDKPSNRWMFRMAKADSTGSEEYAVAAGGVPETGKWVHLAGVYDHPAGQLKLYVNGALKATTSYQMSWFPQRSFKIGHDFGGPLPWNGNWWKGDIDEVRVLGIAATADAISNIMGIAPQPPVSVSASGSCERTGYPGGWGTYVSGSTGNTSVGISSAYVSYSATGVDPGYGAASGTVSLSVSGSWFSGRFPSTSGWEFVGGSGASWTVTVRLTDGRTLSTSGYTSRCA